MNPIINRFHDMGFSIIPTGADKRPLSSWKKYQEERASIEQINNWFANGNNPAVVCGKISGGLVVLDCDDPKVSDLLEIDTFTVQTPSGGLHLYVKSSIVPKKVQAYKGYALDIQGEAAYVVAPSSTTQKGTYEIIKDVEIKGFADILEYMNSKLVAVSEERPNDIKKFREKVGTQAYSEYLKFEYEGHNYKKAICPFHGDNDPSLTVYDNGGYHCFGCSAHGDIIDFVMRIEDIVFSDAIKKLSEISGVKAPIIKHHEIENNIGVRSQYLVTDMANAFRFVDMYRDDVFFVPEWQKWLSWTGRAWKPQPNEHMYEMGHKTVMEMYKIIPEIPDYRERMEFAREVPKCENTFKIKGMLEQAKPYVLESSENFDKYPMIFVAENGVLNLETLKFEPHDRKRKVTQSSNVVYNPDAKCPKWESSINKAFKGNKETIRFFQKALGYSMSGSTREQCFFILWGNGANLKTTLMEVACSVLGDYHKNMDIRTIQEKKVNMGGPSPELAVLAGARLVKCGENKEEFMLSEGLIKQITGSDGKISCRRLHENDSSYVPEYKLFVYTNHKPQIRGTDYGIWRRVRLLPFTYTIPDNEKIPDYHNIIIAEELSGVLNWMIEGARLWRSEGLGTCPDVEEATHKFREENDTILEFINEFCDVGKNGTAKSQELYDVYVHDFCEPMGESYLSQREFKKKLVDKGYTHKKGMRWNYYQGIKLKTDTPRAINKESMEGYGSKKHNFPIHTCNGKKHVSSSMSFHTSGTDGENEGKQQTDVSFPLENIEDTPFFQVSRWAEEYKHRMKCEINSTNVNRFMYIMLREKGYIKNGKNSQSVINEWLPVAEKVLSITPNMKKS